MHAAMQGATPNNVSAHAAAHPVTQVTHTIGPASALVAKLTSSIRRIVDLFMLISKSTIKLKFNLFEFLRIDAPFISICEHFKPWCIFIIPPLWNPRHLPS